MINLAAALARLPGVDERRLRWWIAQDWVRPIVREGDLVFAEIDVARLHLIVDLETLDVGESAMPVVLSLLDQLHATRRQMRVVVQALGPEAVVRLAREIGEE